MVNNLKSVLIEGRVESLKTTPEGCTFEMVSCHTFDKYEEYKFLVSMKGTTAQKFIDVYKKGLIRIVGRLAGDELGTIRLEALALRYKRISFSINILSSKIELIVLLGRFKILKNLVGCLIR